MFDKGIQTQTYKNMKPRKCQKARTARQPLTDTRVCRGPDATAPDARTRTTTWSSVPTGTAGRTLRRTRLRVSVASKCAHHSESP